LSKSVQLCNPAITWATRLNQKEVEAAHKNDSPTIKLQSSQAVATTSSACPMKVFSLFSLLQEPEHENQNTTESRSVLF
jgi:hypothetical protein